MKQREGILPPGRRLLEAALFADSDARNSDEASHRSSPAGSDFIALLAAFRRSGGTVPAALLGELHAQCQVERAPGLQVLFDRGELFAFDWRGHFWVPLFQLEADRLTVKVSAREVRAILPRSWSGWDLATWFTAPHALLQNLSPVDVLDASAAEVISAARSQSSPRSKTWSLAFDPGQFNAGSSCAQAHPVLLSMNSATVLTPTTRAASTRPQHRQEGLP